MTRFALAAVAGAVLSLAGAAHAQTPARMDWRLKMANPGIAVAVAFTPERNGSQFATVMLRLAEDSTVTGSTTQYRGMEVNFEVRCGESRMRMLSGVFRNAGYSEVFVSPGSEWTAFDRSRIDPNQHVQIMVADVCTGAHTETIGLRNADMVSAQRWLDGRIPR